MSRGRITASEVIALLDDESDLAELQGLDLDDDPDSDEGDREEADFINTSGTAELLSSSLMKATGIGEEEPAFQDSLLLLEDDAENGTSVFFWRLLEHCITNSYILFKQVQKPDLRKWRRKKYRMELAYSLTAGIIANRIGQGRTPSDPSLSRLKGKHFVYYHE